MYEYDCSFTTFSQRRPGKHIQLLQERKNSLQSANNVVNDILDEIENLPNYLSILNLQPIYQARGVNFFNVVASKRKSYKIIFFVAKDIINIVTVWDCRQSLKRLKEIMEREE